MTVMNPLLDTEAQSWLEKLLKRLLLIVTVGLVGCSTSYVMPRIPPPAPELMETEPTGSEFLERVTQNTQNWESMLREWLTNSEGYKTTQTP